MFHIYRSFAIVIISFLIQAILIDRINGEVDICFKFNKNNTDGISEISTLFQKASTELKEVLMGSKLGSAGTTNYTYFHIYLSHSAITLEGNATNGLVSIDDPLIRTLTILFDGFEIFNLTFPSIYINGSYNFAGYVGANRLFDIYGKGDFYLHMFNFSIAAVSGLKINTTALCVPLTVKVYLKDFKSHFQNFMNGDEELDPLLNGAMQAIVPDALRIIFREDADFADPYIQKWIDDNISFTKLDSLARLLNTLVKYPSLVKKYL